MSGDAVSRVDAEYDRLCLHGERDWWRLPWGQAPRGIPVRAAVRNIAEIIAMGVVVAFVVGGPFVAWWLIAEAVGAWHGGWIVLTLPAPVVVVVTAVRRFMEPGRSDFERRGLNNEQPGRCKYGSRADAAVESGQPVTEFWAERDDARAKTLRWYEDFEIEVAGRTYVGKRVTREGQMVAVACAAARRIRATGCWTGEILAAERAETNLPETITQITAHAHKLGRVRRALRETPEPEGESSAASAARTLRAQQQDDWQLVESALAERVGELVTLAEHVEALDRKLLLLEQSNAQLTDTSITDDLHELLIQAARDQTAAQNLRDTHQAVAATAAGVDELRTLINDDIGRLATSHRTDGGLGASE